MIKIFILIIRHICEVSPRNFTTEVAPRLEILSQMTYNDGIKDMLTPYSKSQFLSRIFTDATGRQFRLTFLVAVVNGELRGHLVSAQPVSSRTTANVCRQLTGQVSSAEVGPRYCLPIVCSDHKPATEYVSAYAPVISPYMELYFFTSQPTRAPSHR